MPVEASENSTMIDGSMRKEMLVGSFDIRVVEETGSTNDDLKMYARNACVNRPFVLEAKHQIRARGTRGRSWKSAEGCMAFSLLLPFSTIQVPVSLVSIAVGIGVCRALREVGCFACLKWPNDVWFEGGKCGGILCETVRDAEGKNVLIAGVGLNRDSCTERTTHGWSISGLGGVLACTDASSPNPMLSPLVASILGILTAEKADVAATWPLYDAFAGRAIRLDDDEGIWKGLNMGIDSLGRLQLKTNEGVRTFFSGTFFNDDVAY